ncbi:TPA: fructose-bisphosphate aldolase, partial [Enterococcus faecium]|nr:fructose-bisphosphate aldolase [Enterococcus faecium]
MFGKIGSLVKNCLNKFSFTKLRRNFIMPVVSGA